MSFYYLTINMLIIDHFIRCFIAFGAFDVTSSIISYLVKEVYYTNL